MYFTLMEVKYAMKKNFRSYDTLVDSFNLLRKESGITIKQLCKDSHVSTRTYAKFVKKKIIRSDCYVRLFIGSFKGATKEEIQVFLLRLLDEFYDYYSEYDVKRV